MKHKYDTNHSNALFIESIIPRDPIVSLYRFHLIVYLESKRWKVYNHIKIMKAELCRYIVIKEVE